MSDIKKQNDCESLLADGELFANLFEIPNFKKRASLTTRLVTLNQSAKICKDIDNFKKALRNLRIDISSQLPQNVKKSLQARNPPTQQVAKPNSKTKQQKPPQQDPNAQYYCKGGSKKTEKKKTARKRKCCTTQRSSTKNTMRSTNTRSKKAGAN